MIKKETENQVKINAPMEEIPGVVVGGKEVNPTPPTIPAPITETTFKVFQGIGEKLKEKSDFHWT